MRLNLFNSLCGGLLLLLSGCEGASDVKQKQHDIFPFPCISKSGPYYVDENGEDLMQLKLVLAELNLPKRYHPGLFQDDLLRIDTYDSNNERICLFVDKDGTIVLNMCEVIKKLLSEQYSKYFRCSDFSHGIAFVSSDLLHSYAINKKGEVVFELDGIPKSAFNKKGQAYFSNDMGHYGIISTSGEILYEPNGMVYPHTMVQWSEEKNMPVENAVVLNCEDGGYILVTYDGKPLSKKMEHPFIPDNNGCSITRGGGGIYSIVDKEGNTLCRIDCDELCSDGKLYWYYSRSREEVGWIDKNGNIKIGPLKRAEDQSRNSRIDWYPHQFYGAAYSVGNKTEYSDYRHEYKCFGGVFSPKMLNKMAAEGAYFENYYRSWGLDYTLVEDIIITPVVNGRYVAFDPNRGIAHVYKVGKNTLKTIIEAEYGFYPYRRSKDIDYTIQMFGAYVLDPGYCWHGINF